MLDVALGTLVTYNPRAIGPETLADEAMELMSQLGVHHLPVVDPAQHLVGVVSHRDLADRGRRPSGCADLTRRGDLPVERLMAHTVFTIDHTAAPKSALQALLDHGFHSVPVLEDGVLVGMVTSSDFLRELSYGGWPVADDRVRDHMLTLSSDDLLFSAATETDALVEETSVVSPDQSLATAAGMMQEFGVREIAVVDDFGHPVGVLRDDDVLQAIMNSLT